MIQELIHQTKEFKWVVPTEYDLRDMDGDECRLAIKILKALGNSEVSNPTEILYRGEKLSNLSRRYDPHTNKNIPNVLKLQRICLALFYFGDKAKLFWGDQILKTSSVKLLKNINSDDISTIKVLVKKIDEIITKQGKNSVREFVRNNKDFCDSIAPLRRESYWNYEKLTECKSLRIVRDTLAFVLHNYSSNIFDSPFVSATPDLKCAINFGKSQKKAKDNACIITVFLPKKLHNRVIRSNTIESYPKLLDSSLKLPKSFIENQHNEVGFFGVIFPQYILNLINLTEKTVVWNPLLLDLKNETIECTRLNGFNFDQNEFWSRLHKETLLASGMERDGSIETQVYPIVAKE